jgi:hypothetical protein
MRIEVFVRSSEILEESQKSCSMSVRMRQIVF